MRKPSTRNPLPYPQIQHEELYTEPLRLPGYKYDWKQKVDPHTRLNLNHTLGKLKFPSFIPLIHNSISVLSACFLPITVYHYNKKIKTLQALKLSKNQKIIGNIISDFSCPIRQTANHYYNAKCLKRQRFSDGAGQDESCV